MTDSVCGLTEYCCSCARPVGHAGPHECGDEGCGGSWTFDAEGNFEVVAFPIIGGNNLGRAIDLMLGPPYWADSDASGGRRTE